MGRTVAELQESISVHELAEWHAFDRISPIGDERGDLLAGIITSTMVNIQPRKNPKTYKPSDFMPFMDKQKRGQELSRQIRTAFKANFEKK